MAAVLVIHGPNLNRLGAREPALYGTRTLADINAELVSLGNSLNLAVDTFQSNSEGALIDRIHAASKDTRFIILNPAAYTHTSIALRDAVLSVKIPFVEVHLSNIYQRESFRHHSYFSDIAVGVISGLGPEGYCLALRFANRFLTQPSPHAIEEKTTPWICEKSAN